MARPDKVAAVAEIADEFRGASASVVTEYRGLTVSQLTALRRSLDRASELNVVDESQMARPSDAPPSLRESHP